MKHTLIIINFCALVFIFHSRLDFSNTVDFSGDFIDYQSIAVNFIEGHPFMYAGSAEQFSKYKFSIDPDNPYTGTIADFEKSAYFQFNRNPVYPLFISTIYFCSGVNPRIVKIFQFLLICFSSSLLIYLGYLLHGTMGAITGLLSSWLFCVSSYNFAALLFTESLLSFLMVLLLISWVKHVQKRNTQNTVITAFLLGLCVLAKGVFYYLAILLFIIELVEVFKRKSPEALRHFAVFTLVVLGTITPYVIWQNQQVDESIFIIVQADYVLLTSNNANAIDGDWHPGEFNDALQYDNTDKSNALSEVIEYYLSNKSAILPTFSNKLTRAYLMPQISRLLLFSMLILLLDKLKHKFVILLKIPLVVAYGISVLFYNTNILAFLENLQTQDFLLLNATFILLFLELLKNKSIRPVVPYIFASLLITLTFYGNYRIVLPYFLVFSYLCTYFTIKMISNTYLQKVDKKTLFGLFIFVSSIVLLELGLRSSDRLKTWTEKNLGFYHSIYAPVSTPHLYILPKEDTLKYSPEEFKFNYWINKDGFVDSRSLACLPKDNTIIFLGDSFTFGVGADKEKNVPFLLETQLSTPLYNAGIPGSDPFYEKKLLDSIFLPAGFNKFIFMCNLSDIYDHVIRGGNERFLKDNKVTYRKEPWIEWFYQRSFIVRAFVHKILKMDFSLLPPSKMKKLKTQAIDELATLFAKMPIEVDLIVIIQPYPSQYSETNQVLNEVLNEAYIQKLDSALTRSAIKTLNLGPELNKHLNADNYLEYSWDLDGHFNAKGYSLLADIIANELTLNYPEFVNADTDE